MKTIASKLAIAITPMVAATALYFVLKGIGMPDWMLLALSVSTALIIASLSQAATIAYRSGTRWYRSPALRKFGSDLALSVVVSVPLSALLHARFLFLMYGTGSVFSHQGWANWLGAGGGIRTLFVMFTFAFGAASLVRLFTNRFTKNRMS